MKKTACAAAEELAQRIATAWQQRPPTGYSADITLQFHPPAHRHTYSCHYKFALRSGRRCTAIVVKVAHGAKASDPLAEYAALQRLAVYFRPFPDLTVPQPLLVLAHPPALVMTKLPGQRLLHSVQRLRWRHRIPTEVCTRVQQAGRWLAWLHQMPLLPAQRPATGAGDRFRQAWVALRNGRAPAATGDVIASALQQRLLHMPVEPAVPLHGDYTLRNVLCHETRLAVLDTELAIVGPAELDIANFVAALWYIDWGQIIIGTRLYETTLIETLQQQFIAGYETAGGQVDAEGLAVAVGLQLWQRWADFSVHIARRYPLPLRPALARRLHQHFASQLRAIL